METAKAVEEKSKQAEIAIKVMKSNKYNIEAEEKLNKMLLDSVKVKLEALTSNNK